jgi:hypothetical protein
MKRVVAIIAIFLMLAGTAFAGKSIGNTGSGLITTGQGFFKGLIVNTDGTNAVTITIYDNTAASGNKVVSSFIITTSTTDLIRTLSFGDRDCPYFTGMYFSISTSGTVTYDVFFDSY